MLTIAPLASASFDSWAELFTATGHACFCRYWHFEGTKNDWLARCAFDAEANRSLAETLVASFEETARGLVAIDEETRRVLGWMKLVPLTHVPKLRRLPVYRALSFGEDEVPYAVACVLVHPDARGRGVATELIAAAQRFVREWGGTSILAFPYQAEGQVHDDVLLMGPLGAFAKAGFACAIDRAPYPVWRKVITR